MTDVDERVRSMLEESQIEQAEAGGLVELLTGLEERYVDAVPVPAPELAALFEAEVGRQGAEPLATPWRRRAVAAGVVSLAAVVTTGLTAAANELPDPVQRWVSEFSERYLPFELPAPTGAEVGRESSQGSQDDAEKVPPPPDLDRWSRRDGTGGEDRSEDAAKPQPASSGGDRELRSGGGEAAEEENGYVGSTADQHARGEQEVAEGEEPLESPPEETEDPAEAESISDSGGRTQAESEEEEPEEEKAEAQRVEEEGKEDGDG